MSNQEFSNDNLVKMLIKAGKNANLLPIIYPLKEHEELLIQIYARPRIDIIYHTCNPMEGDRLSTSYYFMNDDNFPDNIINKIINYISNVKQIDNKAAKNELIEFLKNMI